MNISTRTVPATFLLSLLFLVVVCLPGGAQSFFWETPRVLVSEGARFPTAVSGGGLVAVGWQVIEPNPDGGGRVYLSIQTSRDTRTWKRNHRFVGPIAYEDREVQLYSIAIDRSGTIYLAVAAGDNETALYRSSDEGRTFILLSTIEAGVTSLAPNISLTDGGNILLFVTQERGNSLFVYYSVSENGRSWSPFEALVAGEELPINFLPAQWGINGHLFWVCHLFSPCMLFYKFIINGFIASAGKA